MLTKKLIVWSMVFFALGCTQRKNSSLEKEAPNVTSSSQPAPTTESTELSSQKQGQDNRKKLDDVTASDGSTLTNAESEAPKTFLSPFPKLIRKIKFDKADSEAIKYTDFSANNNLLVTVSENPCAAPCSEDQHQVDIYDLNSGATELRPMASFRHYTPDEFIPYLDDWRNSWKPIISSDEKFIVIRSDIAKVLVAPLEKKSTFRGWTFEMPKSEQYTAAAISLSDDNKKLAIGYTKYDAATRVSDRTIKIFDLDSGLLIAEFNRQGISHDFKVDLQANSLYFSPDGNYLTAGYSSRCTAYSSDQVIEVYSIQSKKSLNLLMPNGCYPTSDFFVKSMFSDDSKVISIFNSSSTIQIDLQSGKILSQISEKSDFAWDRNIQLSPNRRFKIVKKFGTGNNHFAVYDLQSNSKSPTMYFWEKSSSYMTNKKYFMAGNQIVLSAPHLGVEPYFTEIYDMSTGRRTANIKMVVDQNPLQLVSSDGRFAIIDNSLWQLH